MTGKQYRNAIKKVGLTQRGAAAFFRVDERTSRRWAKDGAPRSVELVFFLMMKLQLGPQAYLTLGNVLSKDDSRLMADIFKSEPVASLSK
jgi:hypothetical protein